MPPLDACKLDDVFVAKAWVQMPEGGSGALRQRSDDSHDHHLKIDPEAHRRALDFIERSADACPPNLTGFPSADPHETTPMQACLIHLKRPFNRGRSRHDLWMKRHPDSPIPKALARPQLAPKDRPIDPIEDVESLGESPFGRGMVPNLGDQPLSLSDPDPRRQRRWRGGFLARPGRSNSALTR